jgi:toxin ParE1/3/4
MPHRVVFSPEAEAQLIDLRRYIAGQSGLATARRFTDAIVDQCERMGTFPNRGTRRDDLRPGLRTIGFRRRVTIAFSVAEEVVTILSVFYGGQDFEAALGDDLSDVDGDEVRQPES